MITFQETILRLQAYWNAQGCALLQPIDIEVGAGTSHTATFLRAIGPEPWRAAYVQPSRRPKDARYGENPNRLHQHHQFQVVLKPAPPDILDLYLGSLAALGIDTRRNDIRFVEDNWENPTLGAWGLGWEVWMNGMEITQFTYFQQVGGLECKPITGEITYGLERLAMYLQDVDRVFDLVYTRWGDRGDERILRYGDVFHQNEVEQSRYNFEASEPRVLLGQFNLFEAESARLMAAELALPAYEMLLKAGHAFNLLDARGAISVTERAGYIARIRKLARAVAQSYFAARERLGFPLLPSEAAAASPGGAAAAASEGGAALAAPPSWAPPGGKEDSLLVELLTEELPPHALHALGESFAAGIHQGLVLHELAAPDAAGVQVFATPRRLAVLVAAVRTVGPPRPFVQKLVPAAIGLDAQGLPTAALRKKLDALALPYDPARIGEHIARESDGKQEILVYRGVRPGIALAAGLQAALTEAIEHLPIPKVMSYQLADGTTTVQFVRPVHALVALHGEAVVPVHALGMAAGRTTAGHRFLAPGALPIASADAYERTLREQGKVLASFEARRGRIVAQLSAAATAGGTRAIMPEALVDEVTALVEWPVVYESGFDDAFLAVPQSCLVLTMQQNQKYFALQDAQGRLRNRFLLVSNIEAADPSAIVAGNARVVRARLADAKFFFEQDRLQRLDTRLGAAAQVVYHQKLGTQLQRVERLVAISGAIAGALNDASRDGKERTPDVVAVATATRAAYLAKADLGTLMVGEFPELQGEMGAIYARAEGEDEDVATAIDEHYRPRHAGDAVPRTLVGACVALADKLETLAGLFGAGERPSGDRDPYALRRNALGVLRILQENALPLDLHRLLELAFDAFDAAAPPPGAPFARSAPELALFLYERLRGMLQEQGYGAREVDAVLSLRPGRIDRIGARMRAVRAFMQLPEAQNLAAANKRIGNLLRKAPGAGGPADAGPADPAPVDPALLMEPAERELAQAYAAVAPRVEAALAAGDDTGVLRALTPLRQPVDRFFDDVLVLVDDAALRANRLALLGRLRALMNRIADISQLAAG